MVTTRAKFRCESVEKRKGWEASKPFVWTATFAPVFSNDPAHENKKFWDASPSGKIELGTIKEHGFEPGKEYYIDFTEAPISKP